jgi:hypothetical protein
MARWQRDAEAHRQMMWFLALGEVMAVTANFFLISLHYLHWIFLQVMSREVAGVAVVLPLIATAAVLVFVVFQGIAYAKGRAWARRLFLIENLGLVFLGLVWFLVSLGNPTGARGMPVVAGLMLPMVTLFPLLWPLWTLRAEPPQGPAAR